ncbi:structural protein [Salmonella enterica subsp. enterica serovar Thompson]|uniref:structural protein n=1 Tax=Salmonella TaxID=590 RepID=UPI00127363A2|nr:MULTISPECIES: structural protein [Salmonella]EBS6674244.1 structural protein [Salmonella enterica subsp. enterica serovar Stanley]ECG5738783.1 structural protein [Salmonella enterica subsp. enterica serovar Brunei]EDH9954782.1 structural protein [Salmonella enterica subsp. enterica serovar Newport]EDV3647450.1 structural protein [Salmonella enterica subsp. enterica serovar Thompson]EGI6197655.1 structural protein [Salmonella enterica subsp. enterica serovar Eastbourne]MDK9248539.1 structur
MTIQTPRGIRNNNPGNIRWGDDWKGLVPKDQRTDKSFCQFTTPEYGIRAMIIILRNYQRKYGLNTVSGIIKRWAPPNENNTQAYINSVAQATGVTPDQRIDTNDSRFMIKLLQAIIKHENGNQPYSPETFDRAVEQAG